MAGILGTQYTKEQVDAIPGLANALKGAIDTGTYANQSPAQSARRFLDYAMKNPVAWVSNDLQNSIYSGYYNNNDYTLTKSQIDYLKKSNVPQSQITSIYDTALASANKEIGDRESSKSFNPLVLIGGLALSFFLPGVGAAITESLVGAGVMSAGLTADAVGIAIANTAANMAQGQTFEDALKNSVINTAVSTGSIPFAKEVNSLISNPAVTDAIVSAAGSAVKTAATGGTEQDVINNMTGALAGSAASSAYQLGGEDYTRQTGRVIGSAVAGYVTSGPTGAITSAVGELGSQSKGKVAGTIENVVFPSDTGALPASQVAAMTPQTDAGALDPVTITGQRPTDITSTDIISPSGATTPAGGSLPPVTVTAKRPDDITDTDVINAIAAEKKPDAVLPPVTVTGKREEPLALDNVTITGKKDGELEPVTITGKAEEPLAAEEPVPEEKPPEEKPYDPNLFILSGKKPKTSTTAPKTSTAALGQALGTTTGLTASRGAGEIEDPSTGKKRKKVWNEETLRLKDALGV